MKLTAVAGFILWPDSSASLLRDRGRSKSFSQTRGNAQEEGNVKVCLGVTLNHRAVITMHDAPPLCEW